jgi:hypothetical protein
MALSEEQLKRIRKIAAEKLLEELKSDSLEQWYYISIVFVPTNTFHGGIYLKGKGPIDAWHRMHGLNLIKPNCESVTYGPLSDEDIANVPIEKRWKLLSREEMMEL